MLFIFYPINFLCYYLFYFHFLGLPDLEKKATGEPGTFLPTGRIKKVAEPNKKKKQIQSTLQQTMKVVEEDDDDDEGIEDDSVTDQVLEELALSLGLGSDDLLDVSKFHFTNFYDKYSHYKYFHFNYLYISTYVYA